MTKLDIKIMIIAQPKSMILPEIHYYCTFLILPRIHDFLQLLVLDLIANFPFPQQS